MSVLTTVAQTTFEFETQATAEASGAGLIMLVIYAVILIAMMAGLWKMFVKAGKPGWAAIVPIYNSIMMLEIVGRPLWWIVLFFVPIVNWVVGIFIANDLAKSYGHGTGMTLLIIFLPFIAFPMLGFGDAEYKGPAAAETPVGPAGPAAPTMEG